MTYDKEAEEERRRLHAIEQTKKDMYRLAKINQEEIVEMILKKQKEFATKARMD